MSKRSDRIMEHRVLKKLAWEKIRDRIWAEMEELIRDGLDPTTIPISEMRSYGHMF